ncbi:hypothetical protein BDZ45DRAFT_701672 [Acephala macrosclerotiorum]|nr:hypothetical protein BDZ45DRAFT_701672 [Acephala macrosclerotiorum]
MSTAVHSLINDLHKSQNLDSGIEGDFPLDAAVIEKLPPGTKIVAADNYGSSAWTVTARISTILADGTPKRWFLKCATEDSGRMMLEGEFHSMTELYKTMPSFVPEPYAWGKFQMSNPETYFFLCEYIKMANDMPDPVQFCSRVAELHKLSKSPNNCFGFHVTTNQGKFPQAMLQHSIKIDAQENGTWDALSTISTRVITSVIPLLLGPLESDGRIVKPSLIHGDLWDGNIGTDYETGNIYIFDAGAYYAHNEMELGMWRCERHRFVNNEIYLEEYLRNAGVSEPVEMFDDRNRLYCIYMNMWASAHHAGGIDRTTEGDEGLLCTDSVFMHSAYNDMCFLVNKYAPLPATRSDG